ncbi:SIR2 family protein [Morganella morganii]|uniref:SIR2 family protein n=2 Tax=Morganella morganii TaxID=582 RepID=A0AAE4FD64_MORMO|nr:SIR2 family protein [Morganella morganii]MCT1586468.1 SIR2 family protein [Morganella morganii]MDS0898846.1 SIR2 family protein [Morganella morganii]
MYSLLMDNMMSRDYKQYIEDVTDDIKTCIETLECQPILFVGSGFSRRYADGLDWAGLIKKLISECPEVDKQFAFYKQRNESLIDIGSILSDKYASWAWGDGSIHFPKELFDESYKASIYIKYIISQYCKELKIIESEQCKREVESLQEICPHSIITTNYDNVINEIFPEYQDIIGQEVLKTSYDSIGEIFKIHGSCEKPSSLVFDREDYDNFVKKKKYLSAKLLTFFAEHPLLFIGYSAEDDNIKSIISDIDEIISDNETIIPNIYMLKRDEQITDKSYPLTEINITTENNKNVRIKYIVANDFTWVYKAFAAQPSMKNVSPKVLRALLARNYKLVNSDIPKHTAQLDYSRLTSLACENGELEKLYGITDGDSYDAFSANYCYIMSDLASQLGYSSWNYAQQLLQKIKEVSGIDIKATNNQYHQLVTTGKKGAVHKYSREALQLLMKAKNNQPFEVDV